MSKNPAIAFVEDKFKKKSVPELRPGDIVRVHQRIIEAGKERIQVFEGTVIKVSGSKGMDGTFTVRRIASGVGVERTYPLHSPKVAKVEKIKASKVRQAKLYYIRELIGRKSRLKGIAIDKQTWDESLVKEEETPVEEEELSSEEVIEETADGEVEETQEVITEPETSEEKAESQETEEEKTEEAK